MVVFDKCFISHFKPDKVTHGQYMGEMIYYMRDVEVVNSMVTPSLMSPKL